MRTPLDIARIEEVRQAVGTAEVADVSEPIAGGWMCFGGVGSWTNLGCAMALRGPISDDEVDRFVRFYTSRGVEPRLELTPFADESLVVALKQRGFTLREFENVLARDLSPAEDLRPSVPDGLEIRAIDPADDADVEAFVEHATCGFRPLDEPVPDPLARSVRRVCRHERCTSYLAFIDGVPVGGGGMETSEPIDGMRVACLFGTSVHPDHRRRGTQQALIATRLARAREQGAAFACIHSRPGIPTERNAARLGFTLAYTKVVLAQAGEGLVA